MWILERWRRASHLTLIACAALAWVGASAAPAQDGAIEEAINLALNKPAGQSSRSPWSRPDDPQGGVDGIKTGEFGFHTDYERNPWWEVDLGQMAALTEVRIFNRLGFRERARDIQVLVSRDGGSWSRAYAHDGTPFGGNDGQPLVVPLRGLRARHLRLQLAHADYLHLDEVETWGRIVTDDAPVSVPAPSALRAAPAPPAATATGPDERDLTGLWEDDQGRFYQIRQVGREVVWSQDAQTRSASVFRGTIAGGRLTGLWADLPGSDRHRAGSVTLRIESPERMVKLTETVAYPATTWTRRAAVPKAAPVNVALKHPASQSSLSPESRPDDAQGAVDGKIDGGIGFQTAVEANPWWQVDLVQPRRLREVRIFNRLDYNDRAATISVLVSMDRSEWRRVYAHDGTPFGGADGHPLVVDLQGTLARFVRLQLAATTALHLDEVEVHAESSPVAQPTPAAAPVAGAQPAPAVPPAEEPPADAAPRRPKPRAETASTARAFQGFGRVLETAAGEVAGEGAVVALADGVQLEVARGVVAGETEVRLRRSDAVSLAAPAGLASDVYFVEASSRPGVRGEYGLSLPLPAGLAPSAAEVVAVSDRGVSYRVPASPDPARRALVVSQPHVSVDAGAAAGPGGEPARIGYALRKTIGAAPPPERWTCRAGSPGEWHDEPGHAFRIVFDAKVPCEFARFVSSTLQEALTAYNADFPDAAGRTPFAHLSPQNRMLVYLEDDGPNGKYDHFLRWNGAVLVNAALGQKDRAGLRDTLFHEMFHAVQDVYSQMFFGGLAAMWWYEATAEWAGIKYSPPARPGAGRSVDFPAAVRTQLGRYDYLLSIPIEKSDGYEDGGLAYGYALLVDHVERQAPGYLLRALRSWASFSNQLYDQMVRQGRLADTYADFLSAVVVAAPPSVPWFQGEILESEAETKVETRSGTQAGGDAKSSTRRLTSESERAKPQLFRGFLRPLTTRFVRVKVAPQGVSHPRRVRLALVGDVLSDPRALLATIGTGRTVSVLPEGLTSEAALEGLGTGMRELWVAVYNPDPERAATFELTVAIERTQPEGGGAYGLVGRALGEGRWTGSWTFTETEATGTQSYSGGRTERRHFRITQPPPQSLTPGVPFPITVTGDASDEGGPSEWQQDAAILAYDGEGQLLDRWGWATGTPPTVGTNVETRRFTAKATGSWTVTVPKDAPDTFRIEIRVRNGLGLESSSSPWMRYTYRKR